MLYCPIAAAKYYRSLSVICYCNLRKRDKPDNSSADFDERRRKNRESKYCSTGPARRLGQTIVTSLPYYIIIGTTVLNKMIFKFTNYIYAYTYIYRRTILYDTRYDKQCKQSRFEGPNRLQWIHNGSNWYKIIRGAVSGGFIDIFILI